MIIYKATNLINGKCYIGLTQFSLEVRKYQHESQAKKNSGHSFYDAMYEVGKENFEWQVIDSADNVDEGIDKEIFWVRFCNSYHDGYNRNIGGHGMNGVRHTDETKKKMSLMKQGEKCYKAKLNDNDVIRIRFLLEATKLTQKQIAEMYGVTQENISFIKRGKSWSHLKQAQ